MDPGAVPGVRGRRLRQPRPRRPPRLANNRVHRHPRHRGRLGRGHQPRPGPGLCVVELHPALHRRARRPACEGQGRGLARRELGRELPFDRAGARGVPRRSGRLVHGGDVPLLGPAGEVPRRHVQDPAGPPAPPRPRQRARAHHLDRARDAYRPGPVLGLAALLRPARRAAEEHRRREGRPGDDPARLRGQHTAVHGLRRRRRALRGARLQ